ITGFICSYSIKSRIIVSIYNNKNLINSSYRYKSYYLNIVLPIFQIILLVIWSFSQEGYTMKRKYSKFVYYDYEDCAYNYNGVLNFIFAIDFLLSIQSIITSYQGRKIPDEFNDSRRIFIVSIMTIFLVCRILIYNFFIL
ncbi:hypothetical protein BCR36DRAFT_282116, partial [Piromyces finnis]